MVSNAAHSDIRRGNCEFYDMLCMIHDSSHSHNSLKHWPFAMMMYSYAMAVIRLALLFRLSDLSIKDLTLPWPVDCLYITMR